MVMLHPIIFDAVLVKKAGQHAVNLVKSPMMKLIEKIVDKLFDDSDYAIMTMLFIFFTFLVLAVFSSAAYNLNVEKEITLAKIAAGQVIN